MNISRRIGKDDFYNSGNKIIRRKRQRTYNDRTGEIFDANDGKCIIIKYINANNIICKFIKTGYITTVSYKQLKNGEIKDYLKPSVFGKGYLGNDCKDIRKKYPEMFVRIRDIWSHMIRRCYVKSASDYDRYGAVGVTVDESWFNFSTFFYDYKNLPGFDYDKFLHGKLFLDKDVKQKDSDKKIYSKDTCILTDIKTQNNNRKSVKDFIMIHPDGHKTIERNTIDTANKYNLYYRSILNCIHGKRKSHKGYKFKPIEKCND